MENELSAVQMQAVALIAAGRLTHQEIADQLGIHHATFYRWKKQPDFAEALETLCEQLRESFKTRAIASLERRVDRMNRTWHKLQDVIDARAEQAKSELTHVPGAETGLIVAVSKGENVDFQIDIDLLKEMRALEREVATQLGQLVTRSDITSGGAPILDEFSKTVNAVYGLSDPPQTEPDSDDDDDEPADG